MQDLVARSDGLDAALFHDGDLVDLAERGRAVGDDDDDAAALPHREDGLVQGLVAGAVEAGIGLVEHDQERVAVEGAGERDALALAAREGGAAFADAGVVAVRQIEDEFMGASGPLQR